MPWQAVGLQGRQHSIFSLVPVVNLSYLLWTTPLVYIRLAAMVRSGGFGLDRCVRRMSRLLLVDEPVPT